MCAYETLNLEDLPNEEWKPVSGYEGLYCVSNLGRVKMLERKVMANKSTRIIKEHIIRQIETTKGYLHVDLWAKNKHTRAAVHRLVLFAFYGEPESKKECNHKNENRKDNRVENLEWITHKENLNYGSRLERHRAAMLNHPNMSKSISQYDLNGDFIQDFSSIREAARVLGFSMCNIKDCCKGRYKQTHGYIFKYK